MDYRDRRERLVERLKDRGYIKSPEVVQAFRNVERHLFIPEQFREEAYQDHPVSIGGGQTISAPHMVGIMTELLNVAEDSKILEIGCGSGYQAAILAEIAKQGKIYSIERIGELADKARETLKEMGYLNVQVEVGDGTLGLPEYAPYDRIIVTAAAPSISQEYIEQLGEDGRLLIPVGPKHHQTLKGIEKRDGEIFEENHGGCVFVPLVGEKGW